MRRRWADTVMGRLRRWAAEYDERMLKKSLHFCGSNVVIYPPVVFYGPEALDIGDNTSVAPFVHIWCGGRVVIGANCMIASHVAISSLTHDHRNAKMWETMVAKPVHVGNGVWIGAHSVIMPGVTIGDGAVIGAGSVVTRDVAAGSIVRGVPARVAAQRSLMEA
ncbi:MAG: acyltransferase [Burkholderiales bacterium]|nr:acyltransferase [Burkholderiales bacterium]